jgi:hypothetical protein
MTTFIDQELRDAFDAASDFVLPQPGLADRARAGARRRRRRMVTVAAATCAVALGAGATAYAALGHHHVATSQPQGRSRVMLATVDYQVSMLAVSGAYLYVLAGQNNMLTAYDRTDGKLVRQIKTPAAVAAMAVGPGGLVWLSFSADEAGRATGIWLLSPDLRVRSSVADIRASTILPAGRTSALVPTRNGLLSLLVPAPGQAGTPARQLQSDSSLGPSVDTAPGDWSGEVAGRAAVIVTSGRGNDARLVIAGQPGLRFGGAASTQLSAVASTGNALWASTYAVSHGESSRQGPLVRLNSRLTATTPKQLQNNAVLARSQGVWATGDTVWVASGVKGHSQVTTMPVAGDVVALAATSGTVYVSVLRPPGSYARSPIMGYPVPAACT